MIEMLYKFFEETGGIVSTDSRKAKGIFFALKGEKFDANLFAEKALECGAKYAVVDNSDVVKDDRYILVGNVLETLQKLANYHRRQLSIPVMAITGTNGKTTTKELVRDVLKKKYKVIATEGNLNNHIGVPLTLLSISDDTEIAVVEMGANHQGEIKILCDIAEPDFGLITNVGVAHLEGFGSEEGIRKTKGELYDFLASSGGHAFYNADDRILSSMISERANLQSYPYRIDARPVLQQTGFLSFELSGKLYSTNFVGDVNLLNIMAAVSVGRKFGVPFDLSLQAITEYIPSNNRSQIINSSRGNTILLDAYNANPSSMMLAIKNFKNIGSDNKCMILGQMNELGPRSGELHRQVLDAVLGFVKQENLYFVGQEFMNIIPERSFLSAEDVKSVLQAKPILGSVVLVKGSRTNCLETLKDLL